MATQKNEMKFTEKRIIKEFFRYTSFKEVIPNVKFIADYESDIIQIKDNDVHEYEIKLTAEDFNNEFKNKIKKHIMYKSKIKGIPNYYSFIAPKGLINPVSLPENYGLVEFHVESRLIRNRMTSEYSFHTVKNARRMSSENLLTTDLMKQMIRSLAWKAINK